MFSSNTSQVSNDAVYVEDVFSTYLYTGNGSTQTITNGIDLSTKGGLVWTKCRNDGTLTHRLNDTVRGITNRLFSNLTNAESASATSITAVSSTGYTVGSENGFNQNTNTFVSWTFREQAKFFDVVTYTGDGIDNRAISHNLASTPGCIIIKRTNNSDDWFVYHRSLAANFGLRLNKTDAAGSNTSTVKSVSSTTFTIGTDGLVNSSGSTYTAYLFAHDAGGFGLSGTDNVISCGSYTGNGSTTGPTVTLGYEPQWVMVKRTDLATNWIVFDTMRGMSQTSAMLLYPNLPDDEGIGTQGWLVPTATGFQPAITNGAVNANGGTYIYIAIRRGPMKTPTSGTSVFQPVTYTGNNTDRTISSSITSDSSWISARSISITDMWSIVDRMRGHPFLATRRTAAEEPSGGYYPSNPFDVQTGVKIGNDGGGNATTNASGETYIDYQFRRAPGFFDVVCYTGTGSATTVTHNLVVAPELLIVKRRNAVGNWRVYSSGLTSASYFLQLQATAAQAASNDVWNGTAPTSTVFSVGIDDTVNASGGTFVAYLFATVAGVSKVGSYTGTGATLQINCGFTGGARLVLIKRRDSTGDWYVWDSARGIVSGNDPYLLLNTNGGEVTSTDYVDTYSAGFEISSTAPAAINANGGTFIYLAIA